MNPETCGRPRGVQQMKCLSVSDTADALDNWQLHASLCMDQIYRYGLRQTPGILGRCMLGKGKCVLPMNQKHEGKRGVGGVGRDGRKMELNCLYRQKRRFDELIISFINVLHLFCMDYLETSLCKTNAIIHFLWGKTIISWFSSFLHKCPNM